MTSAIFSHKSLSEPLRGSLAHLLVPWSQFLVKHRGWSGEGAERMGGSTKMYGMFVTESARKIENNINVRNENNWGGAV